MTRDDIAARIERVLRDGDIVATGLGEVCCKTNRHWHSWTEHRAHLAQQIAAEVGEVLILRVDLGLEDRYHVRKINDPAGKHDGCSFFVLDPLHDQIARDALKIYADRAGMEGNEALEMDIIDWLDSLPGWEAS